MTLKIEVTVERDEVMAGRAQSYLDCALSSLGYSRNAAAPENKIVTGLKEAVAGEVARERTFEVLQEAEDDQQGETEAHDDTVRERGKPAPGKARRTKAEIAEDEAADAADAARAERSISSGEERVSPDDDPETEAADAADEARETADAEQEPISVLRKLMGQYQRKFGMAKATALCADGGVIGAGIADLDDAQIDLAIEDVSRLLDVKGDEPEKAAETKASEPDKTKADVIAAMTRYAEKFDGETKDQTKMKATLEDVPKIFSLIFGPAIEKLSHVPASGYAKAIAGIDEAIAKNPFKREVK